MPYFETKLALGVDRVVSSQITRIQTAKHESQPETNRRRFLFTLGAGAAAFALNGCSVSSSTSIATRSINSSAGPSLNSAFKSVPTWTDLPTITFSEGVPASISIAMYFSDAALVEIVKNSAELPPGVTYDVGTKSLVYDGTGPGGFTEGHVLMAVQV